MILKFEDMISGTIIRRKYCYINTDRIKYLEFTNKRITFYFEGWQIKRVTASNYNLNQLKKWLGDIKL